MSLLAFRQVSKRFPDGCAREATVLDRVSFEIEVGETAGLIASRRSGKTTLLRIAAGLMAPDEGSVLWDDMELATMSRDEVARARRRGGVAFARGGVWRVARSTSVLEYVATPVYSDNPNMREAHELVIEALETVGAPQLITTSTGDLGLSERLLVELARAIIRRPRLLLVDEPAVFRDPNEADEFYALLRSLPERVGCAMLIASEEPGALRGCQPMMSLSCGRLISTAARRKVIEFPGGSDLSAS